MGAWTGLTLDLQPLVLRARTDQQEPWARTAQLGELQSQLQEES
jgi:hypothetical protein